MILTLRIFLRPSLQSATVTSFLFGLPSSFFKRSTTSLASSFIPQLSKFKAMHILIPGSELYCNTSSEPNSSCITTHTFSTGVSYDSPSLSTPRFPKKDPSEFSFSKVGD